MIKTKKVEWKRRNDILKVDTPVCDCGGEMKYIDSAGCSHNDEFTHFYQCLDCKLVDTSYRKFTPTPEELKLVSYKRVEGNT